MGGLRLREMYLAAACAVYLWLSRDKSIATQLTSNEQKVKGFHVGPLQNVSI
jgi:ligand-binding sensor domain-containing protein